ncbi:MAG: response regulator [Candidatus Firestonebacteria bacterium]|nr:response regulator [Candidatus Firestonebacteria bacterium]
MKKKILIIEDDENTLSFMSHGLEMLGYQSMPARNAVEAVERIVVEEPDLIILDLLLPGVDGFEICQKLKDNYFTSHIPIIIVTAKGDIDNRVKGLSVGADDYVVKPFDPMELDARIKALLRRVRRDLYANPLTRLPGNVAIEEEITECIASGIKCAICYLDIDNFKAYNDNYGFASGDSVIKLTSRIIESAIEDSTILRGFIGHLGGDDFIFIVPLEKVDEVCGKIIHTFDDLILLKYSESDRKHKYVTAIDRQGKTQKFPLMSVSIAVVTNEHRAFTHHLQISEIAMEIKKIAKRTQGSVYVKDRRRSGSKSMGKNQ